MFHVQSSIHLLYPINHSFIQQQQYLRKSIIHYIHKLQYESETPLTTLAVYGV